MNNTAFIVVLGLLTLGQTMPSVPSISLAETAQGLSLIHISRRRLRSNWPVSSCAIP